MKRWFRWLWMLSKRLYKRAAFLAILLLIPLAVLALDAAAQANSGFIHVVLSQTDPADPISSALVERFMSEQSLILFSYVDDPRAATDMVIAGEADAAWVFPNNMEEKMDRFVTSHYTRGGVVTVVEREQTVFSRIAREKLNFALQHYSAPACYLNFTRDHVKQLDALTDEQLMTYFNDVEFNQELFLFRTPDGNTSVEVDNNYLMAPVRGLLGVLMVLCGLAAALFYLRDEEKDTFALVPLRRRGWVAYACLFIAVLNVSVVTWLALVCGGITTSAWLEIPILLLYAVCCAAFCLLLLRLCGSIRVLASVMPILLTVMIVACPIFFDLHLDLWIKLLFPPTYFVSAPFDGWYLLYMVAYAAVCVGLAFGIRRLTEWWRMQRTRKRKDKG